MVRNGLHGDFRREHSIRTIRHAPDSSDAATAISPGLHTYQLARPFIPIDQGDEESFIERWMGWLGEAAQGQLLYPSQLPELDAQGSWRRGS